MCTRGHTRTHPYTRTRYPDTRTPQGQEQQYGSLLEKLRSKMLKLKSQFVEADGRLKQYANVSAHTLL